MDPAVVAIVSLGVNIVAVLTAGIAWGRLTARMDFAEKRRDEDKATLEKDINGIGRKLEGHLRDCHPPARPMRAASSSGSPADEGEES